MLCCSLNPAPSVAFFRKLLADFNDVYSVLVERRHRADHHMFVMWFLLLSSFFSFSSPNLSGRTLDVYHTSTHGVALVRILGHRSETWCTRLTEKYRTQKSHQKSPSRHHRTTLSGHIFATKACIDNRKKLVKQQ